MSKRGTKHTLDESVAAVLRVIEKQRTVNTVAKEYEVSKFTINNWVRKYQADGEGTYPLWTCVCGKISKIEPCMQEHIQIGLYL